MTEDIREMVSGFKKDVLVEHIVTECAANTTKGQLQKARMAVRYKETTGELSEFLETLREEHPDHDFGDLERHLKAVKTHWQKARKQVDEQLTFDFSADVDTSEHRPADEETDAPDDGDVIDVTGEVDAEDGPALLEAPLDDLEVAEEDLEDWQPLPAPSVIQERDDSLVGRAVDLAPGPDPWALTEKRYEVLVAALEEAEQTPMVEVLRRHVDATIPEADGIGEARAQAIEESLEEYTTYVRGLFDADSADGELSA